MLGMTVDWTGIRRQLRKNGDSFVYVLAVIGGIKGAPSDLLAAVSSAVEQANTAMTDADGQEIVWAAQPIASPAGSIVHIKWPGDSEAQTREWLDHLAAALAATGRAGTIKAARYVDLPHDLGNNVTPHPAAFLGYTLTNPLAPLSGQEWLLTEAIAEEVIRDATAWITSEGNQYFFAEKAFQFQVEPEDIGPLLRQAMALTGYASATSTSRRTRSARQAGMAKGGQVTFDIDATTLDWRATLPSLKATLLRDPSALDIGIIRSVRGLAFSWYSIGSSPTTVPYITDPGAWEVNRHMWSQFVPDAHAIQVLTPAHLERASDLSNWDVTELPGDRYLVETRDLGAWFENDCQVPHDVLARARSDFGAMIITTEDIENDPNGWLGGPWPEARS